ncbi:MAG TPA: site-specific integrase [Oligoflexus sp.]|uniref:tyrosine-type recombinase/integrase n=1 Tax=Oligoflexus sp. TaxID=1971216 RepID=UPI002D7F3255|nr:site-specific integrase [Oligoflexus sp.]HET9236131.1 site-specific integrase [Oligoflexus sp.]
MQSFEEHLQNKIADVSTHTTPKVQQALQEFLRRGYERWSSDREMRVNSALSYLQAFYSFITKHPFFGTQRIDMINLDHNSVREVLNKTIAIRGRTSHYDVHVLKTIIAILNVAGEETGGHRNFLRRLSKVASSKPLPHIKSRAESFRTFLKEYCLQECSATARHGLIEMRDKAIIHLLMNTPFRSNTIRSLKRSDLYDDVLSIAGSSMKTRKGLGFKLPSDTMALIQQYLNHRNDDSEFLFVSISGKQISHNALYKAIRKRTYSVLKQRLGIHQTRHVVATFCAKNFGSETAANLLAISVKTLQRHYNLADESDRLDAAIRRINGSET